VILEIKNRFSWIEFEAYLEDDGVKKTKGENPIYIEEKNKIRSPKEGSY
jgi:hypothetical protein